MHGKLHCQNKSPTPLFQKTKLPLGELALLAAQGLGPDELAAVLSNCFSSVDHF